MTTDREFQGYCSRCHEVRQIGSGTYCPVCASVLVDLHEVTGAEVPVGTRTAPAAAFAPPVVAPRIAEPTWTSAPGMPTMPTMPTMPEPKRRRRWGALVAGLAAAALVIGGIVAVFAFVRGSGSAGTGAPAVAPAATVAADSPVLPAATLPAEEPAAQATVPDVATPTIAVPADSTPQATVPPATGGSGGVVIVGSNAFVEESSFTIDGEGRTLYMVAALRNEGSDTVKVSEVTLTIRDAAGAVIGTREEYPIDRVLVPGETTYLYEFTPSMMYWESETNTFPEGWASFDLAYDVESPYVADEWDDVNLSVENVVVGRSGGDVTATGTIRNTSTVPVSSSAEVYVALYDAQGNLLSVAWTYATSGDVDVLQPGDTVPFELPVWFGPQEYDTTVVGAVASPSS